LNGQNEWWINGKRHNENGPAIVWPNERYRNGYQEWYLNGKFFSSVKEWKMEVERFRKNSSCNKC
jgi:hypothetical protein